MIKLVLTTEKIRHCPIKLFCLLLISTINTLPLSGQVKDIGVPIIQNYSKNEYNAGTQTWSVVQSAEGVIYFGNNTGIIEFDGQEWSQTPLPNFSIVRALCQDSSGRIYAGGFEEFGYQEIGNAGSMEYHSLIDKVPEEFLDFDEIWRIHDYRDAIYFQSFEALFKYHADTITPLLFGGDFHFSFVLDDRFFIQDKSVGLMELVEDEFIPVPGTEQFTGDSEIWAMLPSGNGKIVIGTQNEGLFMMDSGKPAPWNIPANKLLIENQIFSALRIDNYYVFGTIQNGLFILDLKGNIIQHINRINGLQNNTILSLFEDNYGNLWLGLDNGIDYMLLNSPITTFYHPFGMGTGYTSAIHNNHLYLGTNQGLFVSSLEILRDPLLSNRGFELVANTKGQVWSLTTVKGKLICGHNRGTYIIDGTDSKLISEIEGGWTYKALPDSPNLMIGGHYEGLAIYRYTNGTSEGWQYDFKIAGFNESVRFIEIENNNAIWISHGYKGIYRLSFTENWDSVTEVRNYHNERGISTNMEASVYKVGGEIIFAAENGILSYDHLTDSFIENEKYKTLLSQSYGANRLKEDPKGNIWYFSQNQAGVHRRREDGGYTNIQLPFMILNNRFIHSFEHVNPIDANNTIFGIEDGFIHYDPNIFKDYDIEYATILREVKMLRSDSVIHIPEGSLNGMPIEIPFHQNSLAFKYAAPFFEGKGENVFSYFLEGYDQGWSAWSSENAKEYTNLREKEYKFHIRSKNINDIEGTPVTFSFEILPPWHRSLLAYVVYLLLITGFISFTLIFSSRSTRRKQEALQLVKEEEFRKKEEELTQEALIAEQKIINLKNEKLEVEVEKEKALIERKNSEMANFALQVTQKNEILSDVKKRLLVESMKVNPQSKIEIEKIIQTIDKDMEPGIDWDQFELHFDQVHGDFIKRLKNKYPQLTPNDLRMCAYLRMNISTKEIAPLMRISVRGVEISRYRLRKKLNLDRSVSLTDYILNV